MNQHYIMILLILQLTLPLIYTLSELRWIVQLTWTRCNRLRIQLSLQISYSRLIIFTCMVDVSWGDTYSWCSIKHESQILFLFNGFYMNIGDGFWKSEISLLLFNHEVQRYDNRSQNVLGILAPCLSATWNQQLTLNAYWCAQSPLNPLHHTQVIGFYPGN